MPRLCSHSSRSYPGRSVRLGRVISDCISDQSGHWWNKPGRIGGVLSSHASEQGSKQPGTHSASRSNP
jgi:hypothetical protein